MQEHALQMVCDGIKLERKGKQDEAMQLYQQAIDTNNNLAVAYSHRGHIYRQQGKIDLVMKDYAMATSLDIEDANNALAKVQGK